MLNHTDFKRLLPRPTSIQAWLRLLLSFTLASVNFAGLSAAIAVDVQDDTSSTVLLYLPLIALHDVKNERYEPGSTPTATPVTSPTSENSTATPTPVASPTSENSTATPTATPVTSPTSENSTATATPTSTITPDPLTVFTDVVWEHLDQAPPVYPNSEGQSAVVNNRLYSFGGYGNTFGPKPWAFYFDPNQGANGQGKWIQVADMPPMRDGTSYGGVTHTSIAADERYIYFAGGYAASSTGGQVFGTNYVLRYDTSTNTYQRLPNLPLVRAAGSLAIVNGELHFFGGTNSARTLETAEHWAIPIAGISGNTWQVRAALPNPRHHMAAVAYDGKIYAIGGQHKHDRSLVSQNSVHMYDPITNTWAEKAPLPQPRNHIGSATVLLAGRIIVLGGQSQHNSHEEEVFVYNIALNTWGQLTPLPQGRHSAVSGILGGKIYLANGPTTDGTNRRTYRGTPVLILGSQDAGLKAVASQEQEWLNMFARATSTGDSQASFSDFLCTASAARNPWDPERAAVASVAYGRFEFFRQRSLISRGRRYTRF